jgi:biotin carboxyl carrier protein
VPPIALGDLQQQLLAIITSQPDEASAVAELIRVVHMVTRAVGLVYFRRDPGQQLVAGPRLGSKQLALDRQRLQWLAESCTKACADNRVEINALPGSSLVSVTSPVPMPSGAAHALCGILHDSATLSYGLAILQLASAYLSLWHVRSTSLDTEQDAASAAALVEMMSRVQACDELQSACYHLAKDMQEYLGCLRVAIGIRSRGTTRCQLASLSGLSEFDRRAELVQTLELAMEEAILSDRLTIWPAPGSSQAATLGHKRLARLAEVDTVASSPLKDHHGKVLGAWLFLGDRALAGDTRRHHMIEAATPHVGTCLALVRRQQRGGLVQLAEAIWHQRRSRRAGVATSLLLLVCAVMLLPLRQRIGCDVKLEPLVHRYVAAPFPGTLKRTLCQPGDLVKADQVLAQLDDRELRWELAGLVADHQRAAKEHDVALATHDAASAQQARLRMKRLELRIELLAHRSAHVDIKSPIDGIVVRGDLAKAIGVPVDTGQTLVEVAPLDQMGAEIAIPDEKIAFVKAQAPVSLRLDSEPRRKRHGKLDLIHPAAEIVNSENVFVGQVVLDNSDGALRPGMAGRATVYAARRPLGWLLVSKPWNLIVRALGW